MDQPSRSAASNRDAKLRANAQTPSARKFFQKAAIARRVTPQNLPTHPAGAPPHISWCKKRAHPQARPHHEPELSPDARSAPAHAPREAAAPQARQNDPANRAPSSPRAAQTSSLPRETRRPSHHDPARRRNDMEYPLDRAHSLHLANAQRHHPKASSCGDNPENRASLAAKFIFAGAHLAQFLERDPPELAPRRRKMIGHIRDRDSKIASQIVIARARRCVVALEIVNLKKPKVNLLAALLTFLAQRFDGQRKKTAHPFLLEKFLHRIRRG